MDIQPYAGFWKRAVAFLIDAFILTIPNAIIQLVGARLMFSNLEEITDPTKQILVPLCIGVIMIGTICGILQWGYCAWFESSKYQATVGKMALGIKVVDKNGERISFGRATGRFFAKIISYFSLYFGCFMAGFTTYRQALHDIMASTFVVSQNHQPGEPLPQYPFNTPFCALSALASLAFLALPVLTFIAILIPVLLTTPVAQ